MNDVSVSSPKMYLVITNISKRNNVRSLLMTSAAFGCKGVFIVGQKSFDISLDGPDIPNPIRKHLNANDTDSSNQVHKKNEEAAGGEVGEGIQGNEGGKQRNTFFLRRFQSWEDCVLHLRNHKIQLMGVEIHERAVTIEEFFDNKNAVVDTAFLMGNEGTGLSEKHLKSCDGFVQIPQYGNGTASLNVNVAASIILHRFYEFKRQWEK